MSDWASANGGMPQGTWLGVYVYLSLINDLTSTLDLHKFVDDCTLTEILSNATSTMQQRLDDFNSWSVDNYMIVNTKKTKEMLLGPVKTTSLHSLQLDGQQIERVTTFKLLGLIVNNALKWNDHVSAICSKASKRLHFLKLLKRAAMSTDELLHYYQTVIRPVLEYACVVWHSSLTKGQTAQLESIQRRAIKIIHNNDKNLVSQTLDKLSSLADRRDELCRLFFNKLVHPDSCLHELLPEKRNCDVTIKLRHAKKFILPRTRTERFKKSAVIHALNNYL